MDSVGFGFEATLVRLRYKVLKVRLKRVVYFRETFVKGKHERRSCNTYLNIPFLVFLSSSKKFFNFLSRFILSKV